MSDDDEVAMGLVTDAAPRLAARREPERGGIGRGLLLAASIGVLAWHAVHGADATRDLTVGWWADAAERADARLDCLAGRLDALVPPGRRVAVRAHPGDEEWRQRVLELAHTRATVVDAGGADDGRTGAGGRTAGGQAPDLTLVVSSSADAEAPGPPGAAGGLGASGACDGVDVRVG